MIAALQLAGQASCIFVIGMTIQDRKRRLVKNAIFSVLSWVSPLVLSFISTPIILKKLGNEAYGIYVVILGFIGYSFTFGIGRAVAKYIAEFRSVDEADKIDDAVSSATWISLAIGVLGALIIAVAARWIVTDILQISTDYSDVAVYALIIGGASIPLTMLSQVFQNILQGVHSFGKLSLLTNVNWVLMNVGNIAIVYAGYGILALLLWNLAVITALAVMFFIAAKRELPEFRIGFAMTRGMFRSILIYGLSIFSYQVFGNILLLFERGWITREFGASATTYYLIPMMLALYMHGFVSSLAAAAFPAFNELLRDRDRLLELYKKSTKVVFALTVFFAASIISCGGIFLRLWIDAEFAEHAYPLLVLHTLTFGLVALFTITWQINEAFHSAVINALITFIWALIAIPLMVFSSSQWQSEGVAFSRFLGVAVTAPAILYLERRFLGSVHWKLWFELVIKVGLAAVTLAIVERFVFAQFNASWVVLIFGSVLGTGGYFLVLLIIGFVKPDERAMVLKMFRREYEAVP